MSKSNSDNIRQKRFKTSKKRSIEEKHSKLFKSIAERLISEMHLEIVD